MHIDSIQNGLVLDHITAGKSMEIYPMYTAHLSTKIRDKGISVNAADPGIVDSDMITMHSWVDPLANLFNPESRQGRCGSTRLG